MLTSTLTTLCERALKHLPPFVFAEKSEADLPLDKFLSKVTSEDNASFAEIMKESDEKRKLKHAWLYEQEEEKKKVSYNSI